MYFGMWLKLSQRMSLEGADLLGCPNHQRSCASGPGWEKKDSARTSLCLSPGLPPSTLELSVNKTIISRALELVCMLLYPDLFFPFPALIRQKKRSEDRGFQVVCFRIFKFSLYALVFPWSIAGCPLAEQSQLSELCMELLQQLFCFLDLTQFQTNCRHLGIVSFKRKHFGNGLSQAAPVSQALPFGRGEAR